MKTNDYSTYSEETQEFMHEIEKYVKKKYGRLEPSWNMSFKLLADNYELYLLCKKSVAKVGVYNSERGLKNPLLSTMKDCNATILKFLQQFGLSIWSESKIKNPDEETEEDFISDLVS